MFGDFLGDPLNLLLLAGWLVPALFQFWTSVLPLAKGWLDRTPPPDIEPESRPGVSVIVPVKGRDPQLVEALSQLAAQDWPELEILVSVGDPDDPAVSVIREVIAAQPDAGLRLLTGRAIEGPNDKVNVLIAPWREARYDMILMTDDNAVSPPGRIATLMREYRRGAGLVSAGLFLSAPETWAGRIETGLMNGHLTRLMLASDAVGFPIVVGKTLLLRKSDLEALGGITRLYDGLTEDVVLQKIMRRAGHNVRIARAPVWQKLGVRRLADVRARTLRWYSYVRAHYPVWFTILPLTGLVFSTACAGALATVAAAAWVWIGALGGLAALLGLEIAFLRAKGGRPGWDYPLIWIAREILMPVFWLMTVGSREVEWRGAPVKTRIRNRCGAAPPRA